MVVVQLIKVGSEVRSFDVSDNPSLGNLLSKADENFVPNTITINSYNAVNENTVLSDGDRVFIGNRVKGNSPFVVEFIRLGQGEIIAVSVEGNVTISQAISMMAPERRAYFYNAEGDDVFQYQISGIKKQANDLVPEPSIDGGTVRVICSAKIKGN